MRDWLSKLFAPYGAETKKVQMTFFFGSWALLAAIGLFIPQAVLTDNPSLRAFTDFMASFIPQIDRVTALNLKPEINRLHYSILWVVSPVYFVVTLSAVIKTAAVDGVQRTYGQAFGMLLASAWFISETMFLFMTGLMHDPTNRIERAMFYHPLSRAIWAPVVVYMFWASIVMILFALKGLVTGHFQKANKSETHG